MHDHWHDLFNEHALYNGHMDIIINDYCTFCACSFSSMTILCYVVLDIGHNTTCWGIWIMRKCNYKIIFTNNAIKCDIKICMVMQPKLGKWKQLGHGIYALDPM